MTSSDMTRNRGIREPLVRLRDEIRRVDEGLRPRLTATELDRFAHELRPDAEARIEIERAPDGDPVIIVRAVKRVFAPAAEHAPLASLTPRERDVAHLVARGMTNAEIARALGIRFGTVKDHVHKILRKLGLRSRQAIVAAVVARG